MSRLRPCPRCGGEMTIKYLSFKLNTFEIRCKTPYCLSMVSGGVSIDEQIEIWNRMIDRKAYI